MTLFTALQAHVWLIAWLHEDAGVAGACTSYQEIAGKNKKQKTSCFPQIWIKLIGHFEDMAVTAVRFRQACVKVYNKLVHWDTPNEHKPLLKSWQKTIGKIKKKEKKM